VCSRCSCAGGAARDQARPTAAGRSGRSSGDASGFKVEAVLKADAKTDRGFRLSKDNKGRLLLGAQRGQPITRVTIEDGKVVKQEQCKLPSRKSWAFSGQRFLYVDANYRDDKQAKHIFGIFRLRDTKNADEFDRSS